MRARTADTPGDGVLVTCKDERLFKPLREHEAAQRRLARWRRYPVQRVLDTYGLPIAFTRKFAEADFNADEIEAMSRAANSQAASFGASYRDLDGNVWTRDCRKVRQNPAACSWSQAKRNRLSSRTGPGAGAAARSHARGELARSGSNWSRRSPSRHLICQATRQQSARSAEAELPADEGVEPLAEPALEADDAWEPAPVAGETG